MAESENIENDNTLRSSEPFLLKICYLKILNIFFLKQESLFFLVNEPFLYTNYEYKDISILQNVCVRILIAVDFFNMKSHNFF